MADYDAVVIGSGSGGLTAAVAMANAGRRVAVFEQHYLPGGYSQSFDLKGYRFSPGIHYIGQLGPGEALRRIYEGLGVADDLVFFEINPDGYDHVVVGDSRFDIPKGADNFRARLKERFPSESQGIDGYFRLVERLAAELGWAAPPRSLKDAMLLPLCMRTTLRFGMMSLGHCLDRYTADPLLRAILSIQAGDHGMAPSRAPMALHAGLQSYYFDGACYPRGGGRAIPDALIRRLRSRGGELHLRADVKEIVVRGGKAVGVRLGSGQEISAGVVISNADPGMTWGRLVPRQSVPSRLRRRVRQLRYSISTLSLFMAVDMDLRAAGLDSGNIWYSSTPDIDASYELAQRADLSDVDEIPGLFFNVTTLKDPTMRTDGVHTVEALALASPDAFARWRDTAPTARPEDYEAMKDYLADKMLDAVERFVPGLRQHVVFRAVGTPLTNIHYLHATRGAIYGPENTLRNLGPFSFPVRTPIPGLFQCGASTLSPGIHGVTKSGLAAAAAAIGCGDDELLSASSGPLRVYAAEDPSSWAQALSAHAPAPAA
jgi:all-trans-retinol 13,14-reductase